MSPLCDLAERFPLLAAQILERDKGKKRNFREESITDLLMASLVGLESYGIRVDFPLERTTGADMDWIFVDPKSSSGYRYLRLYIQSKRAISNKSKRNEKWFYRELDHESPSGAGRGSQAQILVAAASKERACIPLYMFYHPTSALQSKTPKLPAVEGVNIVDAHSVAATVRGGCGRDKKLVEYWRPNFLRLSDILCWPTGAIFVPQARAMRTDAQYLSLWGFSSQFSPNELASRLYEAKMGSQGPGYDRPPVIEPSNEIPDAIHRALQDEVSLEDLKSLKRPRAIFSTKTPDLDLDRL